MRRESSDYPHDKRFKLFKQLHPEGDLRNRTINPITGDVVTAVVYAEVEGVCAFVWDALGFLDIIEQDTLATTRGLGHAPGGNSHRSSSNRGPAYTPRQAG